MEGNSQDVSITMNDFYNKLSERVSDYNAKLVLQSAAVSTGHRDALLRGDIVMRLLSKRQLKELVLYSPQHIARLEKAGKFPKRVQLGPNRVGWVEDEVLDWLQGRLDSRETT
jgi:prophage regulatory protein